MRCTLAVFLGTLVFAFTGGALPVGEHVALAQEQVRGDEAVDVLARGPVHEAFAEVVSLQPTPGAIIPREPPPAVDEVPPEVKPEGENVVWIPGYWAWDEDRDDFIWVSGVWRNVPPGQRWVPGYWTEVPGGYQWISGFWIDNSVQELTYLPEPPESLETGPNVAPPSDNYFWVPGTWIWQDTQYVWRPGYWAQAYEDWTWVPARYCYTPRGAIYLSGYWDYTLPYRGMLFAPVYFTQPVYRQPTYYYTPHSLVNLALLTTHLFVWPNHRHYYFGDYYDPFYSQHGVYPWFRYGTSSRWAYDPIFVHHRWKHRHGERDWYNSLQNRYQYYQANVNARPGKTWNDEWRRAERSQRRDDALVARLDQVRDAQRWATRWSQLPEDQRQQMRNYARQMRDFQQQRRQSEFAADRGPRDRRGPGEGRGPDRDTVARNADQAREAIRGRFRLPEDVVSARQRAMRGDQQFGQRGPGQFRPGEQPGERFQDRQRPSEDVTARMRDQRPPFGQEDAQRRAQQQLEQARRRAQESIAGQRDRQRGPSFEQRGFGPRDAQPPGRVTSPDRGARPQAPGAAVDREALRDALQRRTGEAPSTFQPRGQQPGRPEFGERRQPGERPSGPSFEQRGFGPRDLQQQMQERGIERRDLQQQLRQRGIEPRELQQQLRQRGEDGRRAMERAPRSFEPSARQPRPESRGGGPRFAPQQRGGGEAIRAPGGGGPGRAVRSERGGGGPERAARGNRGGGGRERGEGGKRGRGRD